MKLSLFFFGQQYGIEGGVTGTSVDPYRLLLSGARIADEIGLSAVWTPERHFHDFGGLYADPTVTGAAVAAVTSNVDIRAGSIVLPLHDPIRVAERLAMVDQLSAGRVGAAFASGWHPRDFVLAHRPSGYATRKGDMEPMLHEIQRLWRGEAVTRAVDETMSFDVTSWPRPVQPELPTWLTTAGDPVSYELAGRLGVNVLTHTLGQDFTSITANITAYRAALRAHHPRRRGTVSLMMHTYIADTVGDAQEHARSALRGYLASSMSLESSAIVGPAGAAVSDEDRNFLIDRSLARFYDEGALIGNVEAARQTVGRLERLGVDEVACLVDFGIDHDLALASIARLGAVMRPA